MNDLRSIDVFALSVLSEHSVGGTIGFIRCVQLLATDTPDHTCSATAIVERLALADLVAFDIDAFTITITRAGMDVLVLNEASTIVMLAEGELA